MRTTSWTFLLWTATAALVSSPLLASERTLDLDPEQTEVAFSLQATGHDVHGTLHLQEGAVTFDTDSGAASGRIAIDARAAATGNLKRDKDMHAKVLESDSFPLFVFRPERVEGDWSEGGAEQLLLHGTLAIHGAEQPLTLPAQVTVDEGHVEAVATFEVPYVEWGMHNPSLLFLRVADTVEVTVHAVGTLADRGDGLVAARP